jgi:hypothetical protein
MPMAAGWPSPFMLNPMGAMAGRMPAGEYEHAHTCRTVLRTLCARFDQEESRGWSVRVLNKSCASTAGMRGAVAPGSKDGWTVRERNLALEAMQLYGPDGGWILCAAASAGHEGPSPSMAADCLRPHSTLTSTPYVRV